MGDISFIKIIYVFLIMKAQFGDGKTPNVFEKILDLYGGEIPNYLKIVSKNKIKIRAEVWEGAGAKWITITPKDVIKYYATQAGNICSGIRCIAGFCSDWRMVDNMAKEALEIFKTINKPALRKYAKQYGMELKE